MRASDSEAHREDPQRYQPLTTRRRHIRQWSALWLCLCLMVWMGACKKKNKVSTGNVDGTVIVLQPATERDRIVKNELTLKLKLFDPEKLAHLKVTFQGRVLWEKHFPPNKFNETIVVKKIDLVVAGVKDGRDKMIFALKDQNGAVSKSSIELFIDRQGPSIKWNYPKPGTTLRVRSRADLKVTDASYIEWVKVKHNNKTIKTFAGGPYRFYVDPSDYPVGNLTFWLHGKDSLGNISARSVTFQIVGQALGQQCTYADSCKPPLLCVKKPGENRGTCRKRCRRNFDCPGGLKCLRVGQAKVCERPYYVTKKGVSVAALFERCSTVKPCGAGLVCISPPGRSSSCRARCINGRCRRGFRCRNVPWGSGGGKVKVCIETRPIRNLRQKIGQPCGPGKPCVKEAMCVKAGDQPAKCRKICSSSSDCPSGIRCNAVPGKSQRVCANLPKRKIKEVGPYQRCGNKRACRRGLQCMSSGKGGPVCLPKCGSSYCPSGSVCLRLGGRSICLGRCNPNGGSCPSGTRCRMIMVGQKGGYFCG